MASNYVKLDSKVFSARLKDGQYETATGARRAVGKSEMKQGDKDACYAAVDKHFGVSAKPEKAPKAAKSAKTGTPKAKRTAAVKTGAVKTRGGPRGKRTAAKKTTSARGRKGADAEGAPATRELADLQAGASAIQSAMSGLATASEINPDLDVKGAAQKGAEMLQQSIDKIGDILGYKAPSSSSSPPASAPPSSDLEGEEEEDTDA